MENINLQELFCLLLFVGEKNILKKININITIDDLFTLLKNTDWVRVSSYPNITEEFMTKYYSSLSWPHIVKNHRLSEDFIRNNLSKMYQNKELVSIYQVLSEEIMMELDYLLDWKLLSQYQKMSEDFIETNQEKVDWYNILRYQSLSEKFKEKHKHRVSNLSIIEDYADSLEGGGETIYN